MAAASMRSRGSITRTIGIGALAFAVVLPAAWCAATVAVAFHAGFPAARAPFEAHAMRSGHDRWAQLGGALDGDPKLLDFLGRGASDHSYLLAAVNARQAAPIIIATGAPVMAFGGFSGQDPILSVADFAHLVATHQVRYVLIGDGSRSVRHIFGQDGQKPLVDWIRNNGQEVDSTLWRSISASEDSGSPDGRTPSPAETGGIQLYDLEQAADRE
jgi:4-amino-4-deoxy-L-arabinose transferase-like glycosyltransferase